MSRPAPDTSHLRVHDGGYSTAGPETRAEAVVPLSLEEIGLIRSSAPEGKLQDAFRTPAGLSRRDVPALLGGLTIWGFAIYGVWQLLT
jgi:hypothetical protein